MPKSLPVFSSSVASPSPSLPESIPVNRNNSKVGMPKRQPHLLMTMLAKMSTAPRMNMYSGVNAMSDQLCDGFHILSFVEEGLCDRNILEVGKTEQLHGAELVVVAEAHLQTVVANGR